MEDKTNPARSALTSVVSLGKALKANNVTDALKDKDKVTYIINKLVENLEPALIRFSISRKRETWTKEEKESIVKFRETLTKAAVDHHKHDFAAKYASAVRRASKKKSDTDGSTKPSPTPTTTSKKRKGNTSTSILNVTMFSW